MPTKVRAQVAAVAVAAKAAVADAARDGRAAAVPTAEGVWHCPMHVNYGPGSDAGLFACVGSRTSSPLAHAFQCVARAEIAV